MTERVFERVSASTRRLWHGSATGLAVGDVLRPGSGGYVASTDPELEALFEAHRPVGAIPRAEAVYLVAREENIDAAGGATDWISLVEVSPGEPMDRHDLAWYSDAQCCLCDGDTESAADCARSYWSGERHHDRSASLFEYLCGSARVVRVIGQEPDESLTP